MSASTGLTEAPTYATRRAEIRDVGADVAFVEADIALVGADVPRSVADLHPCKNGFE